MSATLILIVATAITFFLVGAVVVATLAMAALSHNQDRMQRRVRLWQDEAARRSRSDESHT
ncbi:hypothetical protein [Nocardiopsis sp. JB363]|uniref:hypothetical protein n=1 Tax=Nocardiopsis sp. JB363 TaxID=1434837 RepID=UPI00097A246E|nr:hypothetical protein [Nocardiopsis sp. JB363]SIO87782.1 hypothetical protein BQ8420_17415 [Nocardiopsis sp. JB363]